MTAGAAIVARQVEMTFFEHALDQLGSGSGQVVQVAGEPGIGKSRLLAELGVRADARGYVVLAGRAAQLEHEAPFAVFVDAFDSNLSTLGDHFLDRLGPHVRAELATAFPSMAAFGGGGPPASHGERFRTHRAVAMLLEELGRVHPTVVVLDDIHWADSAARELLGQLLAYPPRAPVLLAVAFRPAATPPALHQALAMARRDGRARLLELGPLSEAEAGELVGPTLSPLARARLFRDSGGNPFYLEQLVRAVGGSQRGQAATPEMDDAGVPADVRAALATELDSLGPTARRFLEGAAVAGDPFEPGLAAVVADLGDGPVLALLDNVVSVDLVRPTGVPRRFRFRHPIVRRAVYESTGVGWRIGAHARAASALAAAGTPPTDLAHHVERSAAVGDEEAVAVLVEAGRAASPGAPAAAAHWYAAALGLLGPEDPRRLELLVARASALGAAGEFDESHAAVTAALQRLPPGADQLRIALLTVLWLGLVQPPWSLRPAAPAAELADRTASAAGMEMLTGRADRARIRLLRALDALGDPRSVGGATIQVELCVLAAFTSDWRRMAALADQALATSRQFAHQPIEAVTAALRAYAVAALRDPHADDVVTEASRVFDGLPDQSLAQRLDAAVYLAWSEHLLERFDHSERHLGRAIAVSRATGQGQFLPVLFIGQLVPLQYQGRLVEAAELAEAAVQASRAGAPANLLAWALFGKAWANTYLGELDQALALGQEALALLQGSEPTIVTAAARMYLGWTLLEIGDAVGAREELLQAVQGPALPRYGGIQLYELLTRVELALGDVDAAERWATDAHVANGAQPMALEASLASRARAAVLLAQGDAGTAADVALEAAALGDRARSPVEAARARVLAGGALAKAADRPRAVAELEAAEIVLADAGARGFAADARLALRRLGRRDAVRRDDIRGVGALTEREREIAELVAVGRTNRQIATTCFLSPKTVERHLTTIFNKLGVANRAAVARVLVAEAARESTAHPTGSWP